MATATTKPTYAKLNLKLNQEYSSFTFNDQEIKVLKYLPIEDKYDLVMITLQKAKEEDIYNPVKLDMYFNLNLVYLYTDLVFTDKQRENEAKIYDNLMSNGFFTEFFKVFDYEEYQELLQLIDKTKEDLVTYNSTIVSMVKKIINDLPANAEKAANIVKEFDTEKFQELRQMAETMGYKR